MRVPAASVLQRQHAASQRAMAFSPTALAWLAHARASLPLMAAGSQPLRQL
jgi:hypothetical protein